MASDGPYSYHFVPRSRWITRPTPHRSIFTGRCSSQQPTNSVKRLNGNKWHQKWILHIILLLSISCSSCDLKISSEDCITNYAYSNKPKFITCVWDMKPESEMLTMLQNRWDAARHEGWFETKVLKLHLKEMENFFAFFLSHSCHLKNGLQISVSVLHFSSYKSECDRQLYSRIQIQWPWTFHMKIASPIRFAIQNSFTNSYRKKQHNNNSRLMAFFPGHTG